MIRAKDVIVFQGDSITDNGRNRQVAAANDGGALGGGYVKMIAGRLLSERPTDDLRIYNRGNSGDQVITLAQRWDADCIAIKPNMLSVLIGVNDTWRGFDGGVPVPVDRYENVYRQILTDARQANAQLRIVLCEPFVLVTGAVTAAWLPEINQRREITRRLAKEFNATFVPFQAAFDKAAKKAAPNYWLGDGVHPSVAGHGLMAQTWLDTVTR